MRTEDFAIAQHLIKKDEFLAKIAWQSTFIICE